MRANARDRLSASAVGAVLQSAPFVLIVALLFGVPTVLLVVDSFRETTFLGEQSSLSVANYRSLLTDDAIVAILRRTLLLAMTVATLTTAVAVTVGHALAFRLSRGRVQAVLGVIIAAAVFSFVVRVLSWAMVLGDRGAVNEAGRAAGLLDAPIDDLFYSPVAVVVVMTYVNLPLAALLVYSAMQDIDPRQLEASCDLGCGRWRTLVHVVLPQAKTGVISAFALVTMLAASDYIVPSLVGGRRGQTIGNAIFREFTETGAYGRGAALAVIAVGSALVTAGCFVLVIRLVALAVGRLGAVVARPAATIARGLPARWGRVSLSRLATLAACAFLLTPAALVVVFSFNEANALGLPFDGFTTRWYPTVFDRPGFVDALRTSTVIAVVATALSILVGVPAGLALVRLGPAPKRVVLSCVGLTFAVPPAMLGAGILNLAVRQDIPLGAPLTTAIQVAFEAPVVVLVVYGRLVNLDPRVFEAARDLGSSSVDLLRRVTVPILLPSVIGAAALGMAYALDEVVVTNYSIGSSSTVPTWLFSRARNAFTPEINAVGVIMFAITSSLLLVVVAARRKRA